MGSTAVRAPQLYHALRNYCLGSFFDLAAELDAGADLVVLLEEHSRPDRPTLYEYRPLVGAFVEQRAGRLGFREDAVQALAALKDEPAAGIFARAHMGQKVGEDEALRRTILVPLLVSTAERCAGFNWEDGAFERAYAELEKSLFGERRLYAALAPLVGLTAGGTVELGRGLRVRQAAGGEIAAHWPEAGRLLPRDFGREFDRALVLELEADLGTGAAQVPNAPATVARVVSALRLATPGAIAAGPVLFERLDWRPYGVRPVPPLAAQLPPGESTRLDTFRGQLAVELIRRLEEAPADPDLLEALDRWELALFHSGPLRAEELREALITVIGGMDGAWAAAMRAAILLGETEPARRIVLRSLRALVDGDGSGPEAEDAVRRTLVETLLHGDRDALISTLDEVLLGVRPRPESAFPIAAVAG